MLFLGLIFEYEDVASTEAHTLKGKLERLGGQIRDGESAQGATTVGYHLFLAFDARRLLWCEAPSKPKDGANTPALGAVELSHEGLVLDSE